jgi:hypothetical protein
LSQHNSDSFNDVSKADPAGVTGLTLRRVARWGLGLLTFAALLAGLTLLVIRFLIWPSLDDWRPRLESLLSAQF